MITAIDHRDLKIAALIYDLQQASYAVERDLIGAAEFFPLQVTAEEIRREPDTFLGWWDGDRLVGVASFTETTEEIHVGRMVVHPGHFRRGIASALLRAVEERAAPGQRITVSTAEKNEPAVRLYQRHGFEITRRTVLPDGLALVRLAKTAAAAPGS
ncbi:MAG TPA: GNAT family N-acetyltransferase [Longimicrobium sp.]|nr:GNAT family N-acetyltransferase [Longimicrobium sp.]